MDGAVPIGVVLWGVGLLGPGAIALGIWLGTLRSSVRSAHHRLDGINGQIQGLRSDFKGHSEAITERLDRIVIGGTT